MNLMLFSLRIILVYVIVSRRMGFLGSSVRSEDHLRFLRSGNFCFERKAMQVFQVARLLISGGVFIY